MVRVVRLERTVSWSQTRRDTNFAIPGYSISAMIPRRVIKIKIFLSVVIYVVKAAFVPFSATGGNPANAGVARLCGVSPHPIPDTATALPNHPRYQLRHTRLYYFILYCYTYWISAFNPRRFPQKHSRATRGPEKACLFGERTRGVMNEFSPKAETNDMEQPRTMERSLRSLFLHLGAMPSSATGGGIPPRPTAPPGCIMFFSLFPAY